MLNLNLEGSYPGVDNLQQTLAPHRSTTCRQNPITELCLSNISQYPKRPQPQGPPNIHESRTHHDKTNMYYMTMGRQLPQSHLQPSKSSCNQSQTPHPSHLPILYLEFRAPTTNSSQKPTQTTLTAHHNPVWVSVTVPKWC